MDNVLIDDRRIHVDFSQSVAKVKWKGKGKFVKKKSVEIAHCSTLEHLPYTQKVFISRPFTLPAVTNFKTSQYDSIFVYVTMEGIPRS